LLSIVLLADFFDAQYIKTKANNITINNLIKGLLLASELESADVVLKMGMFTLDIANDGPYNSQNINDFMFFVAVLSVRITINQTLRRFNWQGFYASLKTE
jgi:hypothetical protein